jgi:aminomethyltransferase
MDVKKTSLHDQHKRLGAKMAPFANFDMPIQYSSVKEEVLAVRNSCGMFDVSHMGEFFVKGKDAIKFVDYIIPNGFEKLEGLKAIYSPLCREDGTMVDDLLAYKIKDDLVLICVNASNMEKDWNWIKSKTGNFDCELTNKSDNYSLIAIQGPDSEKHLVDLGILEDLEDFPYYSVKEKKFNNEDIITARTGYTGEDGFELFCSHEMANRLWTEFIERKVVPCGLASRDVLRLEVCYPLYGNELNDELTPLDSGLKWTVKMSKENFCGKAALENYTPKFRLAKLSLDKGIPRAGYDVLNSDGKKVGSVVSGTMSVVLGKGIATCLIERELFPKDKKFAIQVRNRAFDANYHTKPFVTGGHI